MQTSVPEFPIGLADTPQSGSSGVWASGELAPASMLSRALAYVVDLIVVGSIAFVLTAGLVLLGFMSFGAGFFLIPPVCAATPAVYSGLTLSSPAQATLGMRLFGLHMRTVEGGRNRLPHRRRTRALILCVRGDDDAPHLACRAFQT